MRKRSGWRSRIVSIAAAVLVACAGAAAQEKKQSAAEVEARVNALLTQLTLDEKLMLLGGEKDFYTKAIPRVGIPALRMSDGPMGVHDYGATTAYPAGVALAASWDESLAKRVGVSMGMDARARGVHFILGPGMNIYRAPMNGRNFEYFGEDPFLASRMAVGVIEGIQSQGVIATPKHFLANNSEYGRMDHSSNMDERTMREIYLPAFEASVKEAHAGALMDAYNLVNNVFMTENGAINTGIAKKEWGFDGIMMSDWGATHNGVAAANGGLDLEMPSAAYMNAKTMKEALQKGEVSQATIDDKVRRLLRTAIAFGFFDRDQTLTGVPLYNMEGREVALEEARGGMVLLKNEGALLPLDRGKVKTIVVLGPNAYPAQPGGGGSSQTKPYNQVSFLEGIAQAAGKNVRVLSPADVVPLDSIVEGTNFAAGADGQAGLTGEYFTNQDFRGEPALVRTDKRVDFRWGDGSFEDNGPADHFSARWTGTFVPPAEDDYKFYVSADDGVRLYVDGELVIDDWHDHAETLDTVTRHLTAGKAYKIKLEYYESVGSATVQFGIAAGTQGLSEDAKRLLAGADAVVLCMGFDPNTETEGADRTFRLPSGQDGYIEAAAKANKNVIVVLTAGGNVDMTRWIGKVPALLHAWYPGQEGGTALGQILFGDYSPSGRLPATFEKRWEDNPVYHSYYPAVGTKVVEYSEGIFVGYRGYEKNGVEPMYPFGFGLSYTTFTYNNLKIAGVPGNETKVEVSFEVRNTGKREGAEVAQVYVGDAPGGAPRAPKELKGFTKVNLKPGEAKRVTVTLDKPAFSFYDSKVHDWVATPGEYTILVGSASTLIRVRGKYTLAAGK